MPMSSVQMTIRMCLAARLGVHDAPLFAEQIDKVIAVLAGGSGHQYFSFHGIPIFRTDYSGSDLDQTSKNRL